MRSMELGIRSVVHLWAFSMPPLKPSHGFTEGIYLSVSSENADEEYGFQGVAIYESVDEWETCRMIGSIHDMDAMGFGELEDGGESLRVRMFGSRLYSAKPEAVDRGINRAVFGGELLAFEKATQGSAPHEYTLTGLRRGLRGTGKSDVGAGFGLVMVTDFRGLWHEFDADPPCSIREFKAVRPRANIMDAEPIRVETER